MFRAIPGGTHVKNVGTVRMVSIAEINNIDLKVAGYDLCKYCKSYWRV